MLPIGTFIWFDVSDRTRIYTIFLPIIGYNHGVGGYLVQLTDLTTWTVPWNDVLMIGNNIDRYLYA